MNSNGKILYSTLRLIKSLKKSLPRIKTILLRSLFTIVELDDGSVGSAHNYAKELFKIDNDVCIRYENYLYKNITKEPLLEEFLENKEDFMSLSIKTSIISALSQSFFKKNYLKIYNIKMNILNSLSNDARFLFKDCRSVTIVGAGGLISSALANDVKKLYISDFYFTNKMFTKRFRMSLDIDIKRNNFKGEIILGDGNSSSNFIKKSDTVSITGSALCNGTMEGLLNYSRNKRVILQGPSASIFPMILFNLGAHFILTTKKSKLELKYGSRFDDSIKKIVDNNYFLMQYNFA